MNVRIVIFGAGNMCCWMFQIRLMVPAVVEANKVSGIYERLSKVNDL